MTIIILLAQFTFLFLASFGDINYIIYIYIYIYDIMYLYISYI